MNSSLKTAGLCLALTVLASASSFAGSLPEGSYKGYSSLLGRSLIKNDVMALLLKKDPQVKDRYFAVLAEYDRLPLTNITRKTAITKWVPRMYAYRIDKINNLKYAMNPLTVNAKGDIVVDIKAQADVLDLKNPESLNGARLSRQGETINFKGRVGSTWENYVAGTYFGTDANTGGDYFSKAINTELTADGLAIFDKEDVKGEFDVTEKAPGMFTFKVRSQDSLGKEKIEGRIGVFVDIVNWKPIATTDELLLINPQDAKNVGFYYERH